MQAGVLDRSTDLKAIQKGLELKMISERLRQLGFTEEGIQQRVSQLSDEQLHRLALKLDEMKVGGDGEVVISLLVIAILVLILIYVLGHRIAITKG
jgi:DNA-binding transcriptional MerR regulator